MIPSKQRQETLYMLKVGGGRGGMREEPGSPAYFCCGLCNNKFVSFVTLFFRSLTIILPICKCLGLFKHEILLIEGMVKIIIRNLLFFSLF